MKVYVKSARNKKVASVVRKSIKYYGNLLMPRKHNQLTVYVNFTDSLTFEECATSEPLTHDKSPKEFDIQVNMLLHGRTLFETLAHEMVHVKQFATNQLKFYQTENVIRFKRTLYDLDDTMTKEYWLLPWEVEAHGLGHGLFRYFVESYDLSSSDLRIKNGQMVAYRKLK